MYDGADRLTSASASGGPTTTYGADANGNRTGRGSDTFTFDQANRLTGATMSTPSSMTATYSYDGDGRRSSKTVTSGGTPTTTTYLYDVNRRLPVVLEDGRRRYVWGPGGVGYSTDLNGNTVQAVYHGDALGSTRALTDATGTLTDTYAGDEFGIPGPGAGTSTQPFGYTGEMRDAETGLLNLRARLYDAETGRMLQHDPVSGRAL